MKREKMDIVRSANDIAASKICNLALSTSPQTLNSLEIVDRFYGLKEYAALLAKKANEIDAVIKTGEFDLASVFSKMRQCQEAFSAVICGLAYMRALKQAKEVADEIKSDSKDVKEMLELVNSLGKEEIEFLKKVIEIKERELERKAVEE